LDFAAGTVSNFGTVQGGASGLGVGLFRHGSVVNGSASDTTALITAAIGVSVGTGVTVTNFATILGSDESVQFGSPSDRLIAEAGSDFVGAAQGSGGTLELAAASGTISGLGALGTISGGITMTFFTFGSYDLDAGGSWTFTGTNTLAAHGSLQQLSDVSIGDGGSDAASFTIAAHATWTIGDDSGIARGAAAGSIIRDRGLLIKSGGSGRSVIGVRVYDGASGQIEAGSGTLDLTRAVTGTGGIFVEAGATLAVQGFVGGGITVDFEGGDLATLAILRNRTFNATIAGFAFGDAIDMEGKKITDASINGSDRLVLVDGARTVATLQLTGTYVDPTFNIGSDGFGGTDIYLLTGASHITPPVAPSPHAMVAAMAGFGAAPGSAHAAPAPPAELQPAVLLTPR